MSRSNPPSRTYGATGGSSDADSSPGGPSESASPPVSLPSGGEQTPLLSVEVTSATSLPTAIVAVVESDLAEDSSYKPPPPVTFRLYAVRWYILLLFSLMSLYNNMLCYTFTSVHQVSHRYYHGKKGEVGSMPLGIGMSTLVSCYFVSYILFSFPTAIFIERYGLKAGVLCGAWLQAIGCFVRVLATPDIGAHPLTIDGVEDPNWVGSTEADAFNGPHGEMGLLLVGQLIVSLGQAFFVNPAPLLAATWFGVNERTLATTIAVNANTLGIAVAYLLGPAIVSGTEDLPKYVWLCFGLTLFTALLTTVYFPARPKSPPSHSQSVEPEGVTVSESPDASDAHIPDVTGLPSKQHPQAASSHRSREVRVSLIQVDGANIIQVTEQPTDEPSPWSPDPNGDGANGEDECEECVADEEAEEEEDEDAEDVDSSEECDACERSSSESSVEEEEWRAGQSHSHAHSHAHPHAHSHSHDGGHLSRDYYPGGDRRAAGAPSSSSAAQHHHHHYQYHPSTYATRGPAIIPPRAPLSSSSSNSSNSLHDGRGRGSRARRTKSAMELALEAHYLSMAAPPCSFVVRETLAEERARVKNASRILASWHGFRKMFQADGFAHTLLVFGVSEATINGLSAFMNQIVEPWGYTSMRLVGFMVCALIGMCMVGSAVIGLVVDRSKAFKFWILTSLFGSGLALLYLIHIGPISPTHIWIAVLSLGFFIGPIQPLSIETAVEVTYPAPESSVTAVQQVLGNIFSAALFPLILLCQNPQTHSMTAALYLIFFYLIGTGAVYCTFDGTYRRLAHEKDKERAHRDLHRRLHDQQKKAKQEAKKALWDQLNSDAQRKGIRVDPLTQTPSSTRT